MTETVATRLKFPPRTIERVVREEQKVPDRIQLTLSVDQAQTLAAMFNKVGGLATNSRRGYVDQMQRALIAVGIAAPRLHGMQGGFSCDNEPGLPDLPTNWAHD